RSRPRAAAGAPPARGRAAGGVCRQGRRRCHGPGAPHRQQARIGVCPAAALRRSWRRECDDPAALRAVDRLAALRRDLRGRHARPLRAGPAGRQPAGVQPRRAAPGGPAAAGRRSHAPGRARRAPALAHHLRRGAVVGAGARGAPLPPPRRPGLPAGGRRPPGGPDAVGRGGAGGHALRRRRLRLRARAGRLD
ncbi:hypothetical protein APUTEX25_001717, partial [Auxenochlorella protothecoides]